MDFTDIDSTYQIFSHYKHDTIKKFEIIQKIVDELNAENLTSKESLEILEWIHKSFQQMTCSARETFEQIDRIASSQ